MACVKRKERPTKEFHSRDLRYVIYVMYLQGLKYVQQQFRHWTWVVKEAHLSGLVNHIAFLWRGLRISIGEVGKRGAFVGFVIFYVLRALK